MIYLDNNATTPVAGEVLDAMTPYYRELYGNAHAAHTLGRRAHDGVEQARASIAKLIRCNDDEVIFTSCGTEGNALVIRGLIDSHPTRRKIVTTAVEHPSVMLLLRALERDGLIELAVASVGPDGGLDLDALRELVDDRTLLVSAMLAQNEIGVIYPIAEIAAIAHDRGALVHVDAVQAAGKIAIDSQGLDFLTISGHKFHAPKGVGALMKRRGLRLAPLWYGGGQELGLRSGTEPVPSIVGMGVAAELAAGLMPPRVAELRDRLESELLRRLENVSINGATQPRLPNTSSISFHGREADAIVRALDAEGICVSAGAACNSGRVEPSATMRALGLPLDVAMGAVRFSLSRYTTEREIGEALDIVERNHSTIV
jgi:cysteine desulfurase